MTVQYPEMESIFDALTADWGKAGSYGKAIEDLLAAILIYDVDQVRAEVAASASLTLDKSAWTKVFFSHLGGGIAADQGMTFGCSVLDANTLTLENHSAFAVDVGISALRVT